MKDIIYYEKIARLGALVNEAVAAYFGEGIPRADSGGASRNLPASSGGRQVSVSGTTGNRAGDSDIAGGASGNHPAVSRASSSVSATAGSRTASKTSGSSGTVGSSGTGGGGAGKMKVIRTITEIYDEAERTAGGLMSALAVDFITPLGRGDMAAVVMSLRRVICLVNELSESGRRPECDASKYLSLAQTVESFARRLGRVRKKGKIPSATDYFAVAGKSISSMIDSGGAKKENSPDLRGSKSIGCRGWANAANNAGLIRLYDRLCDCCETLICAALNNI